MPRRTVDPVYVPLTVTTPAGTPIGAPLVTAVDVPAGTLESVDLTIPPGHSGTTGIRFTMSAQTVLPWSASIGWIVGDDLRETFAIGVEVDTRLDVVTYNLGSFDHSHYLRFRVRQLSVPAGLPTANVVDLRSLNN